MIPPGFAIAHLDPEFFNNLSPRDRAVALFDLSLWLRPAQLVPEGNEWISAGWISGRGNGKTLGIAYEINRRVESGECTAPALMAPTETRVREVQAKNIVATSPPWFRAEHYGDGVRWPNGVVAECHTPEASGRSRSGNFDFTWLTEIVDWTGPHAKDSFENITTATRVGRAQYVWDTTSKGKNQVILSLLADHNRDPRSHRLRRGTTYDNPFLTSKYLRALVKRYGGPNNRRYQEEVEGKVFAEDAGALWEQKWLDDHRAAVPPAHPDLILIGIDPALSARSDADETGLVVGARTRGPKGARYHILRDHTGHHSPSGWVEIVIKEYHAGAAGGIVERNHSGDNPRDLLKVHLSLQNPPVRLITLEDDGKPFPARNLGVFYLRETTSTRSKETRAQAPAALYARGLVSHVGKFDDLETQQTTWVPGASKSPNRLDAAVFAVGELAGVALEDDDKPDNRGAVAAAVEANRALATGSRGGGQRGLLVRPGGLVVGGRGLVF